MVFVWTTWKASGNGKEILKKNCNASSDAESTKDLINEVCLQRDDNCSFDSSNGALTESNLSETQNLRKRKRDKKMILIKE